LPRCWRRSAGRGAPLPPPPGRSASTPSSTSSWYARHHALAATRRRGVLLLLLHLPQFLRALFCVVITCDTDPMSPVVCRTRTAGCWSDTRRSCRGRSTRRRPSSAASGRSSAPSAAPPPRFLVTPPLTYMLHRFLLRRHCRRRAHASAGALLRLREVKEAPVCVCQYSYQP
jgi:hypothetical protein